MGRHPCCKVDGDLKKGPWTPDEDEKLIDYITKNGRTNWQLIPKKAGLNRCGKSCRLRWTNYLRPDIKRGAFSTEEEEIIINLHSLLGNKWSRIASHLPGRTDNEIKNYYNTHLRKKLMRLGIDPKTHKPISDLNFLINLSHHHQFPPSKHNHLLMNNNNNNPLACALRLQAEMSKIQQVLQSLLTPIYTNNPLFNYQETSSISHVAATNSTSQLLDSLLVNSCGTTLTIPKLDNSTFCSNISNSSELSNHHQGELINSETNNAEADHHPHVINHNYVNPAWEKNHQDVDDANSSFWNDIFQ